MNHYLARSVLDWRWFFHAAKAEMGIASSWEPLANLARSGGPSKSLHADGNRAEERRLAAARRHARIEAALCAVPTQDLRLIRLTCEEPIQTLRLAYGELGNAAHLTPIAFKALRTSGSKRSVDSWVDRLAFKYARARATSVDLNTIAAIRRSTEDVMEPARNSYIAALGRIRLAA